MSYVPANSSRDLLAFFGALAAVVVAMQLQSRRERLRPGEIIAECADGSVIGVRGDRMLRRAGRTSSQRDRLRARYPGFEPRIRAVFTNNTLKPGDLSLVRVRPGRDDDDAWVIESLGADRQHTVIEWGFDDEAAARAALEALNRSIVQPALDANGTPVEATHADLDAAIERERLEAERDEPMEHAPA
jgi:hypothetical protein